MHNVFGNEKQPNVANWISEFISKGICSQCFYAPVFDVGITMEHASIIVVVAIFN